VVDRIKFHIDEHVDPDIARALRRYGIDVTTTVDAGLRTRDDPVHLDFIRREGRVRVPVRIDNRTQELAPEINSLLTNSIHAHSCAIGYFLPSGFQAIAGHILQGAIP
jgi:hypothetical protein